MLNKLRKILLYTTIAVVWIVFAPSVVKANVPVDAEHFPDENFRACVSNKIDKDKNGVLSEDEISWTEDLSVNRRDIRSLEGIKYFTALQDLDCSGNQLTTLDVSGCVELEKLNCVFDQLATLDVSGCTALTHLNCDQNRITTLNVNGCMELEELSCSFNMLTGLDVSGCTALTHLNCDQNRITTLDLSSNVNLEEFYGKGNKFTEIDVSALTNLTKYDGTLDTERMVLVYDTPSYPPEVEPDATISVGEKHTFKTSKKVDYVEGFEQNDIVKVKTKKKKVIVTGKSVGTATIMAYDKKGNDIGSWIVKVE